MSAGRDELGQAERTLVVDASVFITLAAVDAVDLLVGLDGDLVIPTAVANELTDEPAIAALASARETGRLSIVEPTERIEDAAKHLGVDDVDDSAGDLHVLALALSTDRVVVVTDDKPLRKVCKALSVPVSGSIGVLIRAVERVGIGDEEATATLYAMDEVGARLSASLVRKAERLIEEAADD